MPSPPRWNRSQYRRANTQVRDVFLEETALNDLAHCGGTALTAQQRCGNTATFSNKKDYTSKYKKAEEASQSKQGISLAIFCRCFESCWDLHILWDGTAAKMAWWDFLAPLAADLTVSQDRAFPLGLKEKRLF